MFLQENDDTQRSLAHIQYSLERARGVASVRTRLYGFKEGAFTPPKPWSRRAFPRE
jgi:hypothetical protein